MQYVPSDMFTEWEWREASSLEELKKLPSRMEGITNSHLGMMMEQADSGGLITDLDTS